MTVHLTVKAASRPKNAPVRSKRQAKRAIFSAGRRGVGHKADLASISTCNLKPAFPLFFHHWNTTESEHTRPFFTWNMQVRIQNVGI